MEMKKRREFQEKVQSILDKIDAKSLEYNEEEFWLVQWPYEYIEHYAYEHQLINTAIALPLARGLHNGTYRKSTVIKKGVEYRVPYLIHCLMVCRMLVDLNIPVSKDDEDIMLAAAICHDMIEDIPFPKYGEEMMTKYYLDYRVYEVVKKVSKKKGFTIEEEKAFFHEIESDKIAFLVKLSDRSHNVEDLYNMSVWKVHEYVGETKRFFYPMCDYGLAHYPELVTAIGIFQDKILSLTQAAEFLVDRFEEKEQKLIAQLNELKEENNILREEWKKLQKGICD